MLIEAARAALPPLQAVILAGGRGTRLGELTTARPKPMVEIQGRPFLEYQIEQLREQGFKKVLLLLGYLPHVIQDHFGNGSAWGIEIEYSVSAVEDETARRIKLAERLLDPFFLLLYCDNYWPMQLGRMWHRFAAANVPAMVTVYANTDSYTRHTVRVDGDSYLTTYDKSGTTAGLQGTEISYTLMSKSLLQLVPDTNISIEEALYPRLIQQRQLLGYVTHHRYYSVGSTHRLPLTEAFFRRRPAVILDRDGVLNRRPPKAEYVRTWNEFAWLPGAQEALRLLNRSGYRVVVVSNQAGVARGAMCDSDVMDIHARMRADAVLAGGCIDAVYYCPHGWNEGCECRKPKPGMLFQAQRDFQLDLTRTLVIGDDERDIEAAIAAGCPWKLVSEGTTLLDVVHSLLTPTQLQHPIPQER